MKANASLAPLQPLLGSWSVTGSHPALPGRQLPGKVTFESIEGGAFIRMRSQIEDPEFPEGVAIFGADGDEGTCTMLYYDSRGVARLYQVAFHEDGFAWSRDSPKFAQTFRVTFAADGHKMEGRGMMKREGLPWEADLSLSYVRV